MSQTLSNMEVSTRSQLNLDSKYVVGGGGTLQDLEDILEARASG